AKGPWVERWVPRPGDGRYGLALNAAGLRATAYGPLRHGHRPLGILAVGSGQPGGPRILERRMSALSEFGEVTVARIGLALSTRQMVDSVRQKLTQIIETSAFTPVYQPIVGLGDRSAIAYEALTRFADGCPPERRFVEADSVGMGIR